MAKVYSCGDFNGFNKWALLCDYAFLTDGRTGVIGIFEVIDLVSFPSIDPQLFFVVSMMVTPDDGELKIGSQISSPGGSVIGFLERQTIPPQNTISTHFSLFGFYALPLPEVGEYHDMFRICIQTLGWDFRSY